MANGECWMGTSTQTLDTQRWENDCSEHDNRVYGTSQVKRRKYRGVKNTFGLEFRVTVGFGVGHFHHSLYSLLLQLHLLFSVFLFSFLPFYLWPSERTKERKGEKERVWRVMDFMGSVIDTMTMIMILPQINIYTYIHTEYRISSLFHLFLSLHIGHCTCTYLCHLTLFSSLFSLPSAPIKHSIVIQIVDFVSFFPASTNILFLRY